jgi:hypothetical protein
MAKLDPTSPGSSSISSLPSRVKPSRPTGLFYGNRQTPSSRTPFDYTYDCPSPTTTSSLPPPPTEAALSFDQFAPVGGINPNIMMVTTSDGPRSPSMGETFQPSLPFDVDVDIVQSMQSMTDPNVWQDISLPGMYEFQPNFLFPSAYIQII